MTYRLESTIKWPDYSIAFEDKKTSKNKTESLMCNMNILVLIIEENDFFFHKF